MKKYKETYIIGIDHGYGNMKTANCCFQAGVTVYDKEPIFKDNLLVWNNKYYLISAEHKEFSADKMLDEDYYILTLAAIARELNIAKIYSADVLIAAGLPHCRCRCLPTGICRYCQSLIRFFRCKYALRYWQRHDEYYVRQ